jgi:hypothetical protein
MAFDYSLDFDKINFRKQPQKYRIGRGEQGVLKVEPYKSEILPHWRFRTPDIAQESSEKIYRMFEDYLDADDFVGADMARKFLQMGYTRARRYANHKSGRKYEKNPQKESSKAAEKEARKNVREREEDPEKAKAAAIFKEKLEAAKSHPHYQQLRKQHREAQSGK